VTRIKKALRQAYSMHNRENLPATNTDHPQVEWSNACIMHDLLPNTEQHPVEVGSSVGLGGWLHTKMVIHPIPAKSV